MRLDGKKAWDLLNGKKIPIAFVIFIITTAIGYGELKTKVAYNAGDLTDLKEVPQQVASIQTDVSNIKEDVGELKLEQREMRNDIKEILKAVVK